MKYFLVYVLIGVVLAGSLAVYFFSNVLNPAPTVQFTDLPTPPVNSGTKVFSVVDQGRVRNPNAVPVPPEPITQNTDVKALDDDFFELTEDDDIYAMYYYTSSRSLTIILYQVPLEFSRALAERKLRTVFDVSEDELCAMDITVITNGYVDPRYAGGNLGLSFCAGSVVLE